MSNTLVFQSITPLIPFQDHSGSCQSKEAADLETSGSTAPLLLLILFHSHFGRCLCLIYYVLLISLYFRLRDLENSFL